MRLEWIGCCFRIELELFPSKLQIRRYRVRPAAEMLTAKRNMMRRLSRELRNGKGLLLPVTFGQD